MVLVAPRYVESSPDRDRTLSCLGRQILIQCTTREVQSLWVHAGLYEYMLILPIQNKTTAYSSHAFCLLSCFSRVWLFEILFTIAHQAPLSMGFSRQEYWKGLPFCPPGDLPDPGIKPGSCLSPSLAGEFFATGVNLQAYFLTIWSGNSLFGIYPKESRTYVHTETCNWVFIAT